MPEEVSESQDVEAAKSPAHIVFNDVHHPNDPRGRGRAREQPASSRRSGTLSRSRAPSSGSAGGRMPQTTPYGNVQIEYRTLSIHVSESRRVEDNKDCDKKLSDNKGTGIRGDSEYFANLAYHELDSSEVCQRLNVAVDEGLSESAAALRLSRDGPNVLPHPKTNYWKKILGYVFGGFCSILWVGAVIFFLCWQPLSSPPSVQNLSLAALILVVIFLQAGFSAFQDWSTSKTMHSILDLIPSEAFIRRDGLMKKVKSKDLVTGDVVHLHVGDKVPADLRVISQSGDLRFDRSVLTGESEEIEASVNCTDPNFLESRNIALMGTTVLNGSGVGVVILTGARSVMGRIAHSTISVKDEPTLIQREIWRFVRIIITLTLFLALLILVAWAAWLRVSHPGFMSVTSMLVNVMACVVAFIPEGVPVGVALTLMLIARRMRAADVLPKSLATVETLGCVTVICSDKTGTLTEGRMFVNSVAFIDKTFESTEEFYKECVNRSEDPKVASATSALCTAAHRCNDASFDPATQHLPIVERVIQGNATDSAVLRFAAACGVGNKADSDVPRAFEVPFNSKNKWMLTLHENSLAGAHNYHLILKGAPDVLIPTCTHYWSTTKNMVVPLTPEAHVALQRIQDTLSRRAERVIVLCEKTISLDPTVIRGTSDFSDEVIASTASGLTVIGVLGIIDPARAEIPETVQQCRLAGTRFFMVTGDYGLTAAAIARNIGILTGDRDPDTIEDIRSASSALVPVNELNLSKRDKKNHAKEGRVLPRISRGLLLEGRNMLSLSQEDWDVICSYEEIVFARTTPEQKLRIVTELRGRDNIVAVTGDGVNDAPALRAANVGVAVVSGSDVAIEAADIVLLGSFDSIVTAMRLGRLVFQNLQKVIVYLLPAGSWSEIWPVILNVFLGVPLPLSAFLMIIICVFTDLFLSLSLIVEKEEFDLLSLPPRHHRKDHLINMRLYSQAYLFTGTLEAVCAHAMFFLYMYKYAGMPASELFLLFENYKPGYRGYTADELAHFNATGQCVYFVALLFLQWGNILAVRNRRLSIVQADPVTKKRRNPWLVLSMIISLCIAIFVTEVPGIQSLFGTASVPLEFWFIPIPLGLGILCIDEIRKVIVRAFPRSFVAKVAW